jgi:hypothetical protein
MNQVSIVPSKEGNTVSAYASNPKFGYIQLSQSAIQIDGGWMRTVKRSALLRAETATLVAFVSQAKGLLLDGKIVVKEFLESELPADVASKYLNKDVSFEEAIAPYIKRAGAEGVELTLGGERILRFSNYDPSGNDPDVFVSYDNVEAVTEQYAAQKATDASLPK